MTTTHGFALIEEREIPEINSLARRFRHTRTGAELLSLENADTNKCFGVSFFTPPDDSTGLPHILEHCVLNGSRKYPIKEPFVELLKGSLNTFLNAFTGSDITVYPVASQNLQDFYNLVDVYLDAVFFPNISERVLAQEGWHYAPTEDGGFRFGGVVYNEMKGAYSSPGSLIGRYAQRSLFPDTIYHHDAGGDPAVIPQLTYAQFRAFHERHYHPANAQFYFYGDDDPEERLRLVDAFLADITREAPEISREIAPQPPFAAPIQQQHRYDGAPGSGYVRVNWLLPTDGEAPFGFGGAETARAQLEYGILAHILTGSAAAPLRVALMESGLGEDVSGGGFDANARQFSYSVGLKGVADENAAKVEPLILETLQRLADEGIDPKTAAAALNTIEFNLREANTGGFPRGLAYMLAATSTWHYGGDPLAALSFAEPLAAIQKDAAQPGYFERIIRDNLLENTHRSAVIMLPDSALKEELAAAKAERLAAATAAMDEAARQAAHETARQLREWQDTPDTPEALATIPTLGRDDLEKRNRIIPSVPLDWEGARVLRPRSAGTRVLRPRSTGTRVLLHELSTNGIAYVDLAFDLRRLPAEDLPWVSLLSRAMLGMGTAREDYVRLSQRIGQYTGGIHIHPFTAGRLDDDAPAAWLVIRGKATPQRIPELCEIFRDILLTTQFDDRDRFRQLLLEQKGGKEASLIPAGHQVINSRLKAQYGTADWAAEQLGGLEYLFALQSLSETLDKDWPAIVTRLQGLRERLIGRGAGLVLNVTTDASAWPELAGPLRDLVATLPARAEQAHDWQPTLGPRHEALTLPAQVNYVGKAANLYALGHQLRGSDLVALHLLRTDYLWDRIRVRGGAYGGFCAFDRRSGTLSYLSYRDPHIKQTLAAYDGAAAYLRDLQLSEGDVTRYIIGVIGQIDDYQLPDAKGFTALARELTGDAAAPRQQLRDEVLATTAADIRAFAAVLERAREAGSVVILGAEAAIAAANEDGWLEVRPVLRG